MFQNKEENFFFTAEFSIKNPELCLNMNSSGINFFLEILYKFSINNKIIIDNKKLTKDKPEKGYFSVSEIVIYYKPIESEDLIVNLMRSETKVYMYASQKGIDRLIDSLVCLKESIQKNRMQDISFMTEELGGKWLLDKKIIPNSEIICHLRLYGILG